MNRYISAALASVLILTAGCGGSSEPVLSGDPGPGGISDGMRTTVLRNASGLPTGVRVVWSRSTDADAYHLYRSATTIPNTARGNSSFWVSVNGDTTIPQPGGPGIQVFVDDLFPVAIGETWFYRVSAINAQSEESVLSEESSLTISPFVVEQLMDVTVRAGSSFRVRGQNFGTYDPTTDFVRVAGVEWIDRVGFTPVMLDCSVTDWTPGQITATLPLGATKGQVEVAIAGNSQLTPEEMENEDPYITSILPVEGSMMTEVEVQGAHFGLAASLDQCILFDGTELSDPTAYPLFSDTLLRFLPPNLGAFQDYSVGFKAWVPTLGAHRSSNEGVFTLQNAAPVVYLTATPPSGNAPLDVTFRPAADLDGSGTDTFSFDPEGKGITSYRYDFENDGTDDVTKGNQTDTVHSYPAKGTYTCKLTCVDADGAEASKTVDVVVGTVIPTAKINAVPSSGKVPLQVSFDASTSIDPDGTIVKYEWDFEGDGTFEFDSGSANKAIHYYNTVGVRNPAVRVTDNDGASDTEQTAVDGQAGSGNPILVIRNDGGLFQQNYDAILSDLNTLGASYDTIGYYDTVADGFAGGAYRLAIWYRGGQYNVDDGSPNVAPWTDTEVDNYLQIMQDGDYVLLFSQNHGQTEGNEAALPNAWTSPMGFSLITDTLDQTQRRHAWAAGLATNLFVQPAGSPSGIPTHPDSFSGSPQSSRFVADSAGCAEQFSGAGSSGAVPAVLTLGSFQYCGAGYESTLIPPEAVSSGFQPGLYIQPPLAGHNAGMLSWGNSAAPDENIGSGPAYNHVDGPGKLWIIGYGWGNLTILPPPITRAQMLQNVLAWFAPDLV